MAEEGRRRAAAAGQAAPAHEGALEESAREHKAGWFLAGYFALNSAIMGLTLYLPLHVEAVTGLEGTGLLAVFGVGGGLLGRRRGRRGLSATRRRRWCGGSSWGA